MGRARRYVCSAYLRKLLRSIERLTNRRDLEPAVIRALRPIARTTIATPEEIALLIANAEPWLRTIILLASHAGLRRSDCLRVAPANYNAEKRLLTISQKKTGRTVSILVTDALAAHLERITPEHPLQSYAEAFRGKPIRNHTVMQQWNRLKKKTHVNPDLWIHDLRRTAAVSLYELTKDLRAVEAFLGHASLTSTCEYLEHKDPAKLKTYLDQMWKPHTTVIQ